VKYHKNVFKKSQNVWNNWQNQKTENGKLIEKKRNDSWNMRFVKQWSLLFCMAFSFDSSIQFQFSSHNHHETTFEYLFKHLLLN